MWDECRAEDKRTWMGTVSKLNCVNNDLCIGAKILMRGSHLCVIITNDKQLKYRHEVVNSGRD